MNRTKLLALLLCVGPPSMAIAQSTETANSSASSEGRLLKLINNSQDQKDVTDDDRDRKIAKVYRDYARYLEADDNGDQRRADELFQSIIAELRTLTDYQGITESVRFRSLYKTLLRESELSYKGAQSELFNENDEVFQMRAELFAEMEIKKDDPLLENFTTGNRLNLMTAANTVFPMDLQPTVLRAMQGLSRKKDHFAKVRQRADVYFPMMERILREEGVPDELKYLAVVESALNPIARSWAAAGGLWQFIPATGGAYGLNINSYVDERSDPEKATRAAVRHLKDLYERFGDWQLALAGYNCNPNRIERVRREVSQQLGRPATYWDIMHKIPQETRNYVPFFISTYYIMNNPQQFDLGPYQAGPEYTYDVVGVPSGTNLVDVAKKLNPENATTALNFLRALNPELKTNVVPPTPSSTIVPDQILMSQVEEGYNGGYMLRIPKGSTQHLGELAMTKPVTIAYDSKIPTHRNITLNNGPSRDLAELRSIVGAPVVAVPRATTARNTRPQAPPTQPPSVINKPTDATTVTTPAVAVAVPKPEPVKPSWQVSPTPAANVAQNATQPNLTAAETATSTPEITAPVVAVTATPTPRPARTTRPAPVTTPAPRETREATRAVSNSGRRQNHTVASGQTLRQIANDYKVSIADVKAWNNLRGDQINRGQSLTIYSNVTPTPTPTRNAPANANNARTRASASHTVRRGETLSSIARANDMTLTELKRLNNLSSNVAPIGRVLKVKETATPTRANANSRTNTNARNANSRNANTRSTARTSNNRANANSRTTAKKKETKRETTPTRRSRR